MILFYAVDINLQVVGKLQAKNQEEATAMAKEVYGRMTRAVPTEGRTPEQVEDYLKEELR